MMAGHADNGDVVPYAPLDTLKPVAGDVWIVDSEVIGFGPPGLKLPFPTRMTLVRLADGGLFVHSPTPLRPGLRAEVDALGPVRHLVGPNRIHYWWLPDWHAAYPGAGVFVAPGIVSRAAGRIDFPVTETDGTGAHPWDAEIETIAVTGGFMTELVFFHRQSRTLILTDLIENFETRRLKRPWHRLLVRLGGVADPDGGMPRDMRLTFRGRKDHLRAALRRMLALDPERVLITHGRWFPRDGAAELRRAFAWLEPGR